MNKYVTFLVSLILLFSCREKTTSTEHTSYSYFYTKDHHLDSLTDKTRSYRAEVSGDSIAFFESGILVHRERFGLTKNGIYILRGNDSLPLYSFNVEEMVYRDTSLLYFFYEDVILSEKKEYNVGEKKYTLYHFIENGFDETLDSYYMEGEGFICFYQYANDYFLYLNSINAKEVSPVFLTDTSFFALLQMREMDKKIGRKFDE